MHIANPFFPVKVFNRPKTLKGRTLWLKEWDTQLNSHQSNAFTNSLVRIRPIVPARHLPETVVQNR